MTDSITSIKTENALPCNLNSGVIENDIYLKKASI